MKVHIGSTKYDLLLKDKIIDEGKRFRGAITDCECTLEIAKDFPYQARMQTFWHEIVHGILTELGEVELNSDEGFVDSFSKQLYAFSENNKLDKIYEKLRD